MLPDRDSLTQERRQEFIRTNTEQAWSEPVSHGGRSEQVGALRDRIARIEGDGAAATAFGRPLPRKVALGRLGGELALDRLLRGGLLRGTLNEVVAASAGDAGAACGFALALATRFAAEMGRDTAPVVWVMEDAAHAEGGAPYAPGLAAHGLDPARLLVVHARGGADALWAAEEALKCRAVAAVVIDLWRTKTYDLVASRRLLLAAAAGGTPAILVPAGAPGAPLSSAAQARFAVAAAPGPRVASTIGARVPLPGRAAWAVRLARIRAGPAGIAAGFDWEKVWPLVWNHQEACLCDALPVSPLAVPRDRSHPTADRGRTHGRERAA